MVREYDVTFRKVSAELLALLVAAGYTKPDHGRLEHAEPEIVALPIRNETHDVPFRLDRGGGGADICVTVTLPVDVAEDRALQALAERIVKGIRDMPA